MDKSTQALIDKQADPIEELSRAIQWLIENKQYRDDKGYAGKYAVFQIQVIGRLRSLPLQYLVSAKKEIEKCQDIEIKELLLAAML